jgi:hypothetical protein
MATIPRVDSTASELNDFQETKEGKKIYNVSYFEIRYLISGAFVLLFADNLQEYSFCIPDEMISYYAVDYWVTSVSIPFLLL